MPPRRNFLTTPTVKWSLGALAAQQNLVVSTDIMTSDEHEALLLAIEYMYNPTQAMLGPIVTLAAGSNQNNASVDSLRRQEDAVTAIVDDIYADETAMNNVATINNTMAALGGRRAVVANQRAAESVARAAAEVAASSSRASAPKRTPSPKGGPPKKKGKNGKK